jgi:hypothetical protein
MIGREKQAIEKEKEMSRGGAGKKQSGGEVSIELERRKPKASYG